VVAGDGDAVVAVDDDVLVADPVDGDARQRKAAGLRRPQRLPPLAGGRVGAERRGKAPRLAALDRAGDRVERARLHAERAPWRATGPARGVVDDPERVGAATGQPVPQRPATSGGVRGRSPPVEPPSRRAPRRRLRQSEGGDRRRRAIERGEISPNADAKTVIEAVLGPLYFRLLVSGDSIDDAFLKRIVDLAAAGAGA
jgi:hypothetical protein